MQEARRNCGRALEPKSNQDWPRRFAWRGAALPEHAESAGAARAHDALRREQERVVAARRHLRHLHAEAQFNHDGQRARAHARASELARRAAPERKRVAAAREDERVRVPRRDADHEHVLERLDAARPAVRALVATAELSGVPQSPRVHGATLGDGEAVVGGGERDDATAHLDARRHAQMLDAHRRERVVERALAKSAVPAASPREHEPLLVDGEGV
mmetsp:Transcript_21708/g.67299  ORF Transcript_21708/g.67299 Transcript_21708/m.67299 type:complete len:217 (-) Transcript_21708:380-1030(-)